METVLFPTEFGPLGEKAEANAIATAKAYDADLVLLHSFNVPSGLSRLFSDVNEDEIRRREGQQVVIAEEKEKSDQLLLNILPATVA